ncbi:MAG: hypothetical protein AAGM22_24345 [Acidobacteriota bacterium]
MFFRMLRDNEELNTELKGAIAMSKVTNTLRVCALAAALTAGAVSFAPSSLHALGLAGAGDIICINSTDACFTKFDDDGNEIEVVWGRFHE